MPSDEIHIEKYPANPMDRQWNARVGAYDASMLWRMREVWAGSVDDIWIAARRAYDEIVRPYEKPSAPQQEHAPESVQDAPQDEAAQTEIAVELEVGFPLGERLKTRAPSLRDQMLRRDAKPV
jgi:hypothetical protein